MLFQSESADPLKLFEDLSELLESSLKKIVVPSQLNKFNRNSFSDFPFQSYVMPVECIYYGYEFNEFSHFCDADVLLTVKTRCREFLIKLAQELQKRIPKNVFTLEKISMLTRKINQI